MLLAHVVPGYFVATNLRSRGCSDWNKLQRYTLYTIAIFSTVIPDLDVVYNIIVRDFANHSILWTHSLFPYLGLALMWGVLSYTKRLPFLCTTIGLVVFGGLSHLLLDVIVHGTPLFYPLNMTMIGWPPQQVVEGGLWGYLTHPIILLEPLMFGAAFLHWRQS